MKIVSQHKSPKHFGFLLLTDFTLLALSSAIEPLRMANRICEQANYDWKIISETGQPVTASDGLNVNVDCGFQSTDVLQSLDVVFVCGGIRVDQIINKKVLRWLCSINRQGIALGAICTGSRVLAEAGLLDGYRCSVHWENIAALTDLFPNVLVTRSVFSIDRNRYTSSGGTAPIDMMLSFITERCGANISAGIADQFIFGRIRQMNDNQRIPLKHMIGNQSHKLVSVVELMEANIREPIGQEDLANYVDLSRRQIQRLFQRYLFCTPSRYYLQIRLQRARELLRQSYMSLVEISTICGFVSASHFSKSYKEFYGHAPSTERQLVSNR